MERIWAHQMLQRFQTNLKSRIGVLYSENTLRE